MAKSIVMPVVASQVFIQDQEKRCRSFAHRNLARSVLGPDSLTE